MSIGLVGCKIGMTRVFEEDGRSVPVTVVKIDLNRVVGLKTRDRDGYSAVQLAFGEKKPSKVSKPISGHYGKASLQPGRLLTEFRLSDDSDLELGAQLGVSIFESGQIVDVSSVSKGKGFQGGVKRWNFRMQDATHGNSLSHRAPGSIGQCQTPGKVFKGKKMAGQMGNKKVTVQNLSVVSVNNENSLVLIKGSVPGASGSIVKITPAVKAG